MYTMKKACELTGLSYETLKFYCNEGLVPNVKRNSNNHRIFDEKDIAWIKSLICLRNCGLGIQEMKEYIDLCIVGEKSISERIDILSEKRKELQKQIEHISESMEYIDKKVQFYEDVLCGKKPYHSNLIKTK